MANHITNNQIDISNARAGDYLKWNDTLKKFVPGRNAGAGENVVNNITERDALISTLTAGGGVLVADATGDPTVKAGYAYYKWNGIIFIKIAEGESLDIVFTMNNEAYDYSIWDGDTQTGATRHAIANKIKEIDDTILELAPTKAPSLAGKDISYPSTYSGYLPSGLGAQWYPDGLTPGMAVSNVLRITSNYLFSVPEFRSGVKYKPEKYGVMSVSFASSKFSFSTLPVSVQLADTIASTTLGQNVSTSGSVSPHNNFWAHANMYLTLIDSTLSGRLNFQVSHTEAGVSNNTRFFLDDSTESTIDSVSVTYQSKVTKYLSGRQMLGFGTVFSLNYTVRNLFERLYLTINNTTIDCTASTGGNASPSSVPLFTDTFPVANKAIALNIANVASDTPMLHVYANKPGHSAVVYNYDILANLAYKVNTYGVVSTTTAEYFQDEAKRLYVGTDTAFDSTAVLPDGEAQVTSGHLSFNSDYTKSLTIQRYDRMFASASSYSSGSFNIGGFNTASISSYGSGSVNIIIYMNGITPDNRRYFDMGIPFGQGGDGLTKETAIGCRVNNSGNVINYTFGTYSTAYSNREFRASIFFRDNSQVMTSIITS